MNIMFLSLVGGSTFVNIANMVDMRAVSTLGLGATEFVGLMAALADVGLDVLHTLDEINN